MWAEEVAQVMTAGARFNEAKFLADLQTWEEQWTREAGNPYPTTPSGDAFQLALAIYTKYFA